MDRVWAPLVAMVLLALPAGACLMLAHGPATYVSVVVAISLIGLAAGMELDLVAFLRRVISASGTTARSMG